MSILDKIRDWSPIAVGEAAPALSLTADEGTWVRMSDFKDHINVILIFFRSLNRDEVDGWLKGFQANRDHFEEMETAIFGVTTSRTDRLRDYRNSLGLDFYLLYDPFGLDSRKFKCSGRIRPFCKDSLVVVDKSGRIAFSQRGRPDADEILRLIADLEGKPVPGQEQEAAPERSFSNVRNPGQRPDEVHHIGTEKVVSLLGEEESLFTMVDVRTKSEYDADHVPGTVHIPVDEIPHRYQEIGQTTHIIFMCQAGGRAMAAAEFITSIRGSEIYVAEGGMSSWSGDRNAKGA
jgi:rhodanese-related sulfurtransferase/peroxiredoxin